MDQRDSGYDHSMHGNKMKKLALAPLGAAAAYLAVQAELIVAGLGPIQELRLLDFYDLNPLL